MIASEFFQRSPLKPIKKSRKKLKSKEKISYKSIYRQRIIFR
tara:strand:+ start:2816 stop:2941 length:126 start_codon:yes stop_codon:yes gene_type:complete